MRIRAIAFLTFSGFLRNKLMILFLALFAVVLVYSFTRNADSPTPEAFAPMAGNWVGPIGGFLATLFFARWAARRASNLPVAHGVAIGVGTALLDFTL